MLIYNYKKEFLGIDEADLKALGFTNLQQLREESADFADLFVKTPGYIHNFKHVHWIDFITCGEGNEDAKVIIHSKGKNYRSTIEVEPLYLIDNPTQKAYAVKLVHLRELTHKENEQIAGDLIDRPAPKKASLAAQAIITNIEEAEQATPEQKIVIDPYESESATEDVYETPHLIEEPAPLDLFEEEEEEILKTTTPVQETAKEDFKIDLDDIHEEITPKPAVTPLKNATPVEEDSFDSTYVYDPKVASDELGLPVDLIEEFIQDFISQAQEFKEPLYDSLNKGDIDNVKVLSHKLKGVAANLRIEDAFEVLVTINTSNNPTEIETNLRHFYVIISKLAGEEVVSSSTSDATLQPVEEILEDETLDLDFKDESALEADVSTKEDSSTEEAPLDLFDEDDLYMDNTSESPIPDEDVPEKIEIAELADDDFVVQNTQDNDVEQTTEEELDNFMIDEEDISSTDEELSMDTEELDLDVFNTSEETTQDEAGTEEFTIDDYPISLDETSEEKSTSTPIEVEYSKHAAAKEIGLSKENFDELFVDFVSDSREIFEQIDEAISMDESFLWQKHAKRVKAMSDNMRIHDFVHELDTLMRTQENSTAREALTVITQKLDAISALED